jgi:activator of HSP90 ATPase
MKKEDKKLNGFQIGISKTFPVSTDFVWDFLFSDEGLKIWLGSINSEDFELNKAYKTEDGIMGKLTVFEPDCHIRLTWKPLHWTNISIVEVRIKNSKGRAIILFHQTKIISLEQREEMRIRWNRVLSEFESIFKE